jgi:Ig-like domain from next to BRCA1 gene
VPSVQGGRQVGRRGRVAKGPELRTGPVGEFAYQLWELKRAAGDPSYDRMRAEFGALASKSALSAAARGTRLPSWETTWEFVRSLAVEVLGEDAATARQEWHERWKEAADAQTEPVGVDRPPDPPPLAVPEPRVEPVGRRDGSRAPWALAGSIMATVLVIVAVAAFVSVGPAGSSASLPVQAQNAAPLFDGDGSDWVSDVTIPDGSEVKAESEFVKTWEIRNSGQVPWRGRYLQREGSFTSPDSCVTANRVPVPETEPGAPVRISVEVRAPASPGWCQVHWKMVDEDGRILFPGERALFFLVRVVA